jgi:hypothetical protein
MVRGCTTTWGTGAEDADPRSLPRVILPRLQTTSSLILRIFIEKHANSSSVILKRQSIVAQFADHRRSWRYAVAACSLEICAPWSSDLRREDARRRRKRPIKHNDVASSRVSTQHIHACTPTALRNPDALFHRLIELTRSSIDSS